MKFYQKVPISTTLQVMCFSFEVFSVNKINIVSNGQRGHTPKESLHRSNNHLREPARLYLHHVKAVVCHYKMPRLVTVGVWQLQQHIAHLVQYTRFLCKPSCKQSGVGMSTLMPAGVANHSELGHLSHDG